MGYHWARDHRVRHKYAETDGDPYNAMRGFFFAHIGWLYVKKHPEVIRVGKELDFSDLQEDSVVMLQKKLDPWFALYACFVFPAQVAVKFWGESFWPAFFCRGRPALSSCSAFHLACHQRSASLRGSPL